MTTVNGYIRNSIGDGVGDALLSFVNPSTGTTTFSRTRATGAYDIDISSGRYIVVVSSRGYVPRSDSVNVPDGGVSVHDYSAELTESNGSQSPIGSPIQSPVAAIPNGLLKLLRDPAFKIEADINEIETLEAIQLFTRVNLVMGTKVRRQIGGELRDDFLGIRALYYGLRDNSLAEKLVMMREVDPTERLWDKVETRLKELNRDLEQNQSDFDFIAREAKRQFNLGTTNTIEANTQFPVLFNRYVDIATDPSLSFDIKVEMRNPVSDKTRVYEAIDLLRELKQVILQIVRSLSRYGTAATKESNEIWGDMAEEALSVIRDVASRRAGEDKDELTSWATLALLTEQNREDLFPYVTLSVHGTELLTLAKKLYDLSIHDLEDFDDLTVLNLFQPETEKDGKEFFTTKLRREAYFVKRYPLPNWS